MAAIILYYNLPTEVPPIEPASSEEDQLAFDFDEAEMDDDGTFSPDDRHQHQRAPPSVEWVN